MKNFYFIALILITISFCACNNSTITSKIIEDTISIENYNDEDKSMSRVDQLHNIARQYNIMHGDEERASLSEQNPMPNVKQEVDERDKMFVFYYIWNENIAPLESLNHESGMRGVLTEMSNSPQSMNFIKILAKEGYGIRFVVNGSKTNKESVNEASADEIKEMIELTN